MTEKKPKISKFLPISSAGKGGRVTDGPLANLQEDFELVKDASAITVNRAGITYRVLRNAAGDIVVQAATAFPASGE